MKTSSDCVTHAFNTYMRRASRDTRPTIVQLLLPDGTSDSHWYYKSDQVVSTSAFDWPEFYHEYEGPIDELSDIIREDFSPNRIAVCEFLTRCAQKSLEAGCRTYDEAYSIGFGLRKGD